MNPQSNVLQLPERQLVVDQILDARTLDEIEAATQELRAWLRLHPEDTGIREGFESLSLMRDIAEEQELERQSKSSRASTEKVA